MAEQKNEIIITEKAASINGFYITELQPNGEIKYDVRGTEGSLYFFKNEEIARAFMDGVQYGRQSPQRFGLKQAQLKKCFNVIAMVYDGMSDLSGFHLVGFDNVELK